MPCTCVKLRLCHPITDCRALAQVVNTTAAGTAQNPAPLNLVGYSGANNAIYQAGADPKAASNGPPGYPGSTAQYYLPGFDIPGTAANPYTGYPGYQGISKARGVLRHA